MVATQNSSAGSSTDAERSVPTLLRLCLILGSGPHELMGFAEVEPGHSAPGANAVPLGLNDTPEKRRLVRRLARSDSPRIKALARLVALLLPGR